MNKPEIIQRLEEELETNFELVSNIYGIRINKSAEYSFNKNQKINGLCIAHFHLRQIPNSLYKYFTSKSAQENIFSINFSFNQIEILHL